MTAFKRALVIFQLPALIYLGPAGGGGQSDDESTPPDPPVVLQQQTAFVRVTHYTLCCLTANGGSVYPGSTACSTNFEFGQRFRFADGTLVTCNDRGRLYFNPHTEDGWLDVYTWRRDLDGHRTVLVDP